MNKRKFLKAIALAAAAPQILVPKLANAYKWVQTDTLMVPEITSYYVSFICSPIEEVDALHYHMEPVDKDHVWEVGNELIANAKRFCEFKDYLMVSGPIKGSENHLWRHAIANWHFYGK